MKSRAMTRREDAFHLNLSSLFVIVRKTMLDRSSFQFFRVLLVCYHDSMLNPLQNFSECFSEQKRIFLFVFALLKYCPGLNFPGGLVFTKVLRLIYPCSKLVYRIFNLVPLDILTYIHTNTNIKVCYIFQPYLYSNVYLNRLCRLI